MEGMEVPATWVRLQLNGMGRNSPVDLRSPIVGVHWGFTSLFIFRSPTLPRVLKPELLARQQLQVRCFATCEGGGLGEGGSPLGLMEV